MREFGIEPDRLLKERSRDSRLLRWTRKSGTGPEILVQLIVRYRKLGNCEIAKGIGPTRLESL